MNGINKWISVSKQTESLASHIVLKSCSSLEHSRCLISKLVSMFLTFTSCFKIQGYSFTSITSSYVFIAFIPFDEKRSGSFQRSAQTEVPYNVHYQSDLISSQVIPGNDQNTISANQGATGSELDRTS